MSNPRVVRLAAGFSVSIACVAGAGPPQYTIVDMGAIDPGDGVQAFRISSGGVATGRTLGVSNQAFSWTAGGGQIPLPNEASRPFGVGNGANDTGAVVGTGTTTFFGSSPLPLIWDDGVVSQLVLPSGQSAGRANDVNDSRVAVGSAGGGSLEGAVIYFGGVGTFITQTTPGGASMTTAFSINDDGLVAGIGIDPNNAARNVGLVFDSLAGGMTEVDPLPGRNGAIAFDVSDGGHVVGSSMLNQGSGTPFIWTADGGSIEVPLPAGTSQGSARGVNSDGWVVGTASSAFAIPFLYDGAQTYIVEDLLVDTDGWDLTMNTSSSAMSISDDGVIVGTGVRAGEVRAYAMIPVGDPCPADFEGNSVVDAGDLAILLAGWGQPGLSDIDGDGTTDAADLAILLAAWGPCP